VSVNECDITDNFNKNECLLGGHRGEAFFNLAAVLRFCGALFFFGAASGRDTREI
jgi:hypothetical protein